MSFIRCFLGLSMQYLNTLKPFHDGSLKSKNMNHHKDSVVLFSQQNTQRQFRKKKCCLLVIITHKHVYFTGNNLHRNNYSTHAKYEAALFYCFSSYNCNFLCHTNNYGTALISGQMSFLPTVNSLEGKTEPQSSR